MRQILTKIDMFGVPITQTFDSENPTYKSALGGFTTIILYSASLSYALYMFIQRIQSDVDPSATMSNYLTDFSNLNQENSLINLSFWKYNPAFIDPFQSTDNILIPLLIKTTMANEVVSQQNLLTGADNSTNDFGARLIDTQMYMEFVTDNTTNLKTIKYLYYILLVKCTPSLLTTGQSCANKSFADQFYAQPGNTILMDFYFKSLSFSTLKTRLMVERLYLQVEEVMCYIQTSYLKSTTYSIQNTLLFNSPFVTELIDSQRLQSQDQSTSYCQQSFSGLPVLVGVFMQYSNLQTMNSVVYPSLGTILANIGSIISVIFLLRHIVIFFNDYFLMDLIVNQLLEFYYPELKELKLEYKWFYKLKRVILRDQEIDLEVYEMFKKKGLDIMTSKLTFKNIIYELSRIEFILRSMQSRNLLRQSHNIGIKLNFDKYKITDRRNAGVTSTLGTDLRIKRTLNPLILTDEDCELLSYRTCANYHNIALEDPGPQDFYEINHVKIAESHQRSVEDLDQLNSAVPIEPSVRVIK